MMGFTKQVLQLCCLLQALTSLAAGEDNFLHSGCRISHSVRNVLADSLPILMQYPPEAGFTMTVEQDDKTHTLSFNGLENNYQRPRWIAMEVIMKETLELRFQNGTICLKNEDDITINQIPEKTVSVSKGKILPDCPQELPNWKVERHVAVEQVIVNQGDEEVFSLVTTQETLITFDVGNEKLILCWDARNERSLVMALTDCDSSRMVPAHTLLWLKIAFTSQMVQISNPAHDPPMDLRSFHMTKDNPRITFKNDVVDGAVYVVHHLRGFPADQQPKQPQLQRPHHQQQQQQSMKPLDMCMWVSTVIGIFVILVLLIFILLAALFYNRWANARQVLLLLQTEDAKKNQIADVAKMRRDDGGRKPSLPSHPAPSAKIATDNQYLTPREFKCLRTDGGGGGDRVKSEHIYEDMAQVFSDPKENLGFQKTATDDDKMMKNADV